MYNNRIDNLTQEEAHLIFEHIRKYKLNGSKDVKALVRNYLRTTKQNPDAILDQINKEKRRQPSCAKSF
jgi:hypothetical protein